THEHRQHAPHDASMLQMPRTSAAGCPWGRRRPKIHPKIAYAEQMRAWIGNLPRRFSNGFDVAARPHITRKSLQHFESPSRPRWRAQALSSRGISRDIAFNRHAARETFTLTEIAKSALSNIFCVRVNCRLRAGRNLLQLRPTRVQIETRHVHQITKTSTKTGW